MSYLVLARKYRPRSFTEMVGQEHVVQALSNALTQQRLHHAYLFTGTRGVGKTTVSRILAKSLNCQGADGQGGITAEPCGVCQACRDIDAGRFVDYTELDAASNRGVDEVQSLLEQAVYKPVQGRFKVFMIDEVHMLTNTAFNAMLKTLEEPPEYLKFVLATTDPQKVPVTVLSRCLQFNLRPMAPETVFEHLTRVLAQENIEAEPQALRLLSRAARGSMRDALSLTDQAIAFGSGQLQESGVRQMLGSVDRSHVLQLLRALAQWDGAAVVALVDTLRLQGVSAAATLEDMSTVLQRMAVLQAVPGLADQASDDPDAPVITELSQTMLADVTQLLYSLCLHGRTELGLAPDEYAALTMVLLRLLAFQPTGTAATAEKKSLELSPQGSPAPARPVAAPPLVATAPKTTAPAAQPQARPMAAEQPQDEALALDDLPPWEAFEEVPERPLSAPQAQLQPLPVREATPAAAAQPSRTEVLKRPETPLQTTPEGDFWAQVVGQLQASEAITALVRELALQSQLLDREGDIWRLCVDSESLARPASCERLQAALQAAGYAVRLQVSQGAVSDSPAKRQAQVATERMQAAVALIQNDPLVQSLVRDFDAKIVPGSIQPL
jgi:DNA polymerase-3 subunit gamma/tau